MAKPEPAPENNPPPLTLTTNDVLGAIQRLLQELNSYLWGPPEQIDPRVTHAYLERAAMFNSRLPMPADAAGNNNAPEKRKAG